MDADCAVRGLYQQPGGAVERPALSRFRCCHAVSMGIENLIFFAYGVLTSEPLAISRTGLYTQLSSNSKKKTDQTTYRLNPTLK